MTMRASFLLVGIVFTGGCSGVGEQASETRLLTDMEQSLTLPAEALPLARYDRFYALSPRVVEGVLIVSKSSKGEIRSVPKTRLPLERRDGGCGVIRVAYDRETKAWTSVVCNQRA
jgi:hypothetical protein